VYTNNAGAGGIDRIPLTASGRYVRVLGLQSGTGNGYDLLDFTVTTPVLPPVLNISQTSPGSFNLAWAESPATFVIESTSSLQAPINWQPITNNFTAVGGTNYLMVNCGDNICYFRLEQLP
jgi:hypothetical protein